MAWTLDSDRPIYAQLIEKIELDIISGTYKPGEKVPSVRELAAEAAVNPNTMQKAMVELERRCLLYSQRTSGRFITEDATMITETKKQFAMSQISDFFEKMQRLGYSKEEVIALIEQVAREGE